MNLFRKKSLHSVSAPEGEIHGGDKLGRHLSVRDLTFFGIAAIIGSGSFSSMGTACFNGGPGVVLLFIMCGVACGFTALCYAEFAAVWVVPMGGDAVGLSLRGFAREPAGPMWLADFDRLIGADGADVMAYDDLAGGHGRRVRVQGDMLWTARLSGRIAGTPAAAGLQASAHWLRGLMTDAVPVRPLSRWLLSPVPPPQSAFAPRDPVVCVCHGVGARAIDAALVKATGSAPQRLAALQSALRCGTSCGSCVPQLRARAQAIAASPDPAAASAAAVAP